MTTATRNRQIVLRQRPVGTATPECFDVVESPVATPSSGEALIRIHYVSVDPTQRGWMNAEDTYMPAIQIGEVMRATGIGEVVESSSPAYTPGDFVYGLTGWQEWCIADGGANQMNAIPPGIPATTALNIYGITGMTAYFGMTEIARLAPGETVVISAAAGATGSVAGQIAKIQGCRVVGLAGSEAKCKWVTDTLGFDACINYRSDDIAESLRRLCPDGVDVYFDNVGGEILDTVLGQINVGARVVLCGAISQYNAAQRPPGPANYVELLLKRGRMEGFIILDYFDRFLEGIMQLAQWVAEGKVQHAEHIIDGLEKAPEALGLLFTGDHLGKLLIRVADDAT